jgi:hypothetical protein
VYTHFPATSEWINIYDPIDAISGVLRAFKPLAEAGKPLSSVVQ